MSSMLVGMAVNELKKIDLNHNKIPDLIEIRDKLAEEEKKSAVLVAEIKPILEQITVAEIADSLKILPLAKKFSEAQIGNLAAYLNALLHGGLKAPELMQQAVTIIDEFVK